MKPTRFASRAFAALLVLAAGTFAVPAASAAEPVKVTLGAGCFWCVEAIYERVDGVLDVVSGYAGGKELNPTYEQVGSGATGHAEVVQITFDPDKVSLDKLIDLFWKTHDATNPNGVSPDFGPQYRSILFYNDDAQKAVIEKSKAEAQKGLSKPIATQIVKFEAFYKAEEYHQDFEKKNPDHPYIRGVSVPRLKRSGVWGDGKKKL